MVELPPDIARHADAGGEAPEALVVEGYRAQALTQFDAGRIPGLTRIQTEDFLAQHVDLYNYSPEELEREGDLLQALFRRIVIPTGVACELSDPSAPNAVGEWIAAESDWISIVSPSLPPDAELFGSLDRGELRAGLPIMDQMEGPDSSTAARHSFDRTGSGCADDFRHRRHSGNAHLRKEFVQSLSRSARQTRMNRRNLNHRTSWRHHPVKPVSQRLRRNRSCI
jgi:hypothetical protein